MEFGLLVFWSSGLVSGVYMHMYMYIIVNYDYSYKLKTS